VLLIIHATAHTMMRHYLCHFFQTVNSHFSVQSPHKKFTREVSLVALECLDNDSKWLRCKNTLCKLCKDDMTVDQKKAMSSTTTVLVLHMIMRKGNDCDDIDIGHKYASLGEDWDGLHDSIPRMKYTRIITAEKQADGRFLFMCSCGFDFRYQGTCKRV
jgi:hypothetical protein